MRSLLFIVSIFLIISCTGDSQNASVSEKDSLNQFVFESQFTDPFVIDSVADISEGSSERSAAFIKNRLEELIGRSYKERCELIGVNYPPRYVLFRAFKYEKMYEIWVADTRSDTLRHLATLPICAVDAEPGPKLQRGDGKTPEGFYTCKILYGSVNGFMWIKLNNSEINDYGVPQYGSSFKMCLEYPLTIDRNRSRQFIGDRSPGSAICIHGNCVTAGCISMRNKDYLPIFLSARFHDSNKYGYPKIHIFPFRFDYEDPNEIAEIVRSQMSKDELKAFWNEIKPAYDLFEENHKAIKVSFSGNKYNFSEY
jgi:murein L,D-transpeptidase YafK